MASNRPNVSKLRLATLLAPALLAACAARSTSPKPAINATAPLLANTTGSAKTNANPFESVGAQDNVALLMLPAPPSPGATWQSDRLVGEHRQRTTCEAFASPHVCQDALKLQCVASFDDLERAAIILLEYRCPGRGVIEGEQARIHDCNIDVWQSWTHNTTLGDGNTATWPIMTRGRASVDVAGCDKPVVLNGLRF